MDNPPGETVAQETQMVAAPHRHLVQRLAVQIGIYDLAVKRRTLKRVTQRTLKNSLISIKSVDIGGRRLMEKQIHRSLPVPDACEPETLILQ